MARRRRAREIAFQMLYQTDLNPDVPLSVVRDMIGQQIRNEQLRGFAWELFEGTTQARTSLDDRIQSVAENWTLKRMAPIDRNLLRLGAYELFHTTTPHQVIIDEAVELAKRFGGTRSPQFVNGILDRLVPRETETPRQHLPEPSSPC